MRLDEELWRSPDVRLTDLVGTFNAEEGSAWEGFKEAKEEARIQHFKRLVSSHQADDRMELVQTEPPGGDSEPAFAEEKCRIALESLLSTLRPDRLAEFNEIIQQRSQNPGGHAPRFDLSLIQRYVVWRVFDLGWTAERFGGFDELASRRSPYRAAWKAERVGKKYQWIAFHEFLAYIADHYQYVGAYGYGEVERYEGAWQDSLRDPRPLIHPTVYAGSRIVGKPRSFVVGTLAERVLERRPGPFRLEPGKRRHSRGTCALEYERLRWCAVAQSGRLLLLAAVSPRRC